MGAAAWHLGGGRPRRLAGTVHGAQWEAWGLFSPVYNCAGECAGALHWGWSSSRHYRAAGDMAESRSARLWALHLLCPHQRVLSPTAGSVGVRRQPLTGWGGEPEPGYIQEVQSGTEGDGAGARARAGDKATTWRQRAHPGNGARRRHGAGCSVHWGREWWPWGADVLPWAMGRVGEPRGDCQGRVRPAGALGAPAKWALAVKCKVTSSWWENWVGFPFFNGKYRLQEIFFFPFLFSCPFQFLFWGIFCAMSKKTFVKTFHLILKYFVFVCSVKSHLFLLLWQLRVFTKAAMLPHERCSFDGCSLRFPLRAEQHPLHHTIIGQWLELMWHIRRFLWWVHLLGSLNHKEGTYNFPELYFLLSMVTVLASRN